MRKTNEVQLPLIELPPAPTQARGQSTSPPGERGSRPAQQKRRPEKVQRTQRPGSERPGSERPRSERPRSERLFYRAEPMAPALIAKHCNALLSELDRIALEADARANQLAQLFTAVERAHESRSERSDGARTSSVA